MAFSDSAPSHRPMMFRRRYSPTVRPSICFLLVCLFTMSMKFSSSDMESKAAVFPYWKDFSLMCGSSFDFLMHSIIVSVVPRYSCQVRLIFPSTSLRSEAYQ